MRDDAPWEPLLEGREAERARNIVAEIAAAVCDAPGRGARGLAGAAGRAVFLAHASSAGLADEEAAADLLEADVVGMYAEGGAVGLWHGYAGLRWALSHLVDDDEITSSFERIDSVILGALEERPWRGFYDLADGLAGIALALGDTPGIGLETLRRVLDHLERWVDGEPGPDELGCAHGLAGIVGATARLAAAGVEPERCRHVLARGVPQLLAGKPAALYRAGWCRGEAGLAVALLGAAGATGNQAWESAALDRARGAMRHALDEAPEDACICHGVAGVAHLMARIHQATGRDEFRSAAVDLLRRTMAMRRPGEGAAGYPMLRGRATWVTDTSLFIGAAGVGLVLLAASTELPPTWDILLLADG